MASNVLAWDSQEWRVVRDKHLSNWLGEDGAKCVVMLSTIAETWDDLIDKDKDLTDEDISQAFILALIKLDLNPFWQQHKPFLYPLGVAAVNCWMDSEELLREGIPRSVMYSFYLRNFCVEMIIMAAFCVGGFSHMRKVSMEIRKFFAHESYFEWEHRHGRRR